MSRQTGITDLEAELLRAASARTDGLILFSSVSAPETKCALAVASLIAGGLAAATSIADFAATKGRRKRASQRPVASAVITDVGRAAVEALKAPPAPPARERVFSSPSGKHVARTMPQATNVEAKLEASPPASLELHSSAIEVAVPDATAPRSGSKKALLLEQLSRERGAAIAELMTATGWQAHTVRAALSGLKKRGFAIVLVRTPNSTRYRLQLELAAEEHAS